MSKSKNKNVLGRRLFSFSWTRRFVLRLTAKGPYSHLRLVPPMKIVLSLFVLLLYLSSLSTLLHYFYKDHHCSLWNISQRLPLLKNDNMVFLSNTSRTFFIEKRRSTLEIFKSILNHSINVKNCDIMMSISSQG